MDRTTYKISAILSGRNTGKIVEHKANCTVDGDDTITDTIAGVMVRYRVNEKAVVWCYV